MNHGYNTTTTHSLPAPPCTSERTVVKVASPSFSGQLTPEVHDSLMMLAENLKGKGVKRKLAPRLRP